MEEIRGDLYALGHLFNSLSISVTGMACFGVSGSKHIFFLSLSLSLKIDIYKNNTVAI
jgi:hypothetical protein